MVATWCPYRLVCVHALVAARCSGRAKSVGPDLKLSGFGFVLNVERDIPLAVLQWSDRGLLPLPPWDGSSTPPTGSASCRNR
jgi:hypothetical protein